MPQTPMDNKFNCPTDQLTSRMFELRTSSFADVVFLADNGPVLAHRVLAACSPTLKEQFLSSESGCMGDNRHDGADDRVVLFAGYSTDEVDTFLECVYTSQSSRLTYHISAVRNLAQKFQVAHVRNLINGHSASSVFSIPNPMNNTERLRSVSGRKKGVCCVCQRRCDGIKRYIKGHTVGDRKERCSTCYVKLKWNEKPAYTVRKTGRMPRVTSADAGSIQLVSEDTVDSEILGLFLQGYPTQIDPCFGLEEF